MERKGTKIANTILKSRINQEELTVPDFKYYITIVINIMWTDTEINGTEQINKKQTHKQQTTDF